MAAAVCSLSARSNSSSSKLCQHGRFPAYFTPKWRSVVSGHSPLHRNSLWCPNEQSDVIAFREECSHFHRGKVITSTKENILVMFNIAAENKITNTTLSNIMLLMPESQGHLNTPSLTLLNSTNAIDIRALALNIVLLRLKKTYINRLTTVATNPYAQQSEKQADVEFLTRNITIIDKYLKNVLLKLRLRFEKEFGNFIRR